MPDLKINISASGDTSAFNKVANDLRQVEGAGKSAGAGVESVGKAAKQAGADTGGAAVQTEKFNQILGGLAMTGNGGKASVMGLANALRGLFAVLSTGGGIGIAMAAVATLGGLFLALKDKILAPAESAEDLGKRIEAARKAAERLGDVRMEKTKAEIQGLDREAELLKTRLDAVLQAADRIEAAELSLGLAKIEGNEKLTPDQKKQAAETLRGGYSDRKLEREKGKIADDENAALLASLQTEERAKAAEAEAAAQAKITASFEARKVAEDELKAASAEKLKAAGEAAADMKNLPFAYGMKAAEDVARAKLEKAGGAIDPALLARSQQSKIEFDTAAKMARASADEAAQKAKVSGITSDFGLPAIDMQRDLERQKAILGGAALPGLTSAAPVLGQPKAANVLQLGGGDLPDSAATQKAIDAGAEKIAKGEWKPPSLDVIVKAVEDKAAEQKAATEEVGRAAADGIRACDSRVTGVVSELREITTRINNMPRK